MNAVHVLILIWLILTENISNQKRDIDKEHRFPVTTPSYPAIAGRGMSTLLKSIKYF